MSLELVIGQPRVAAQLRAMAAKGNLPAAMLFAGQEGVGKLFAACQLARVLNCRQAPPGEACGECADCRQIERQVHPDVRVVRAEKNQIRIDQVRELQTYLSYAPVRGLLKVVIIDDAHLLNLPAANALLKTLEEPPDETLFILVSHRCRDLLPTIISRCLQLAFLPLAPASQLTILQGLDDLPPLAAEELSLVVRFSGGSIARCRFFLAADRLEWRRRLLTGLAAAAAGELELIFPLAAEIGKDESLAAAAHYLCTTFVRDVLLLAAGGREEELMHPDLAAAARNFVRARPPAAVAAWLDELNRLQSQMVFNINVTLAWEALLMQLATGR